MTPAGEATGDSRHTRRATPLVIFSAYFALSLWYTHPLVQLSTSRIAGDPGDPVLNASVLWWNATHTPLTERWWDAPFFYPSQGVTTFTEHLLGVSTVATPIYWATANPLAAYNLTLFLTWPLSAFAVYLLVRFLSERDDAAILAGLAWGFTPYRLSELGHLQSLSAFWMPIMLLGLHGFAKRRRARWLVLFGVAWLAQALANGYYMLFSAVLVAMWVLYFGTSKDNWRAMPAVAAAGAVSSLPLVPIVLEYLEVHDRYALRRSLDVYAGFSAEPSSWVQVSNMSWLWSPALKEDAHNLFPGITAIVVVILALAAWIARGHIIIRNEPSQRRAVRLGCGAVALASLLATILMLVVGPWRLEWAGLTLRMADLKCALLVLGLAGPAFALMTPALRRALDRRSPVVFYTLATVVLGLLACGPLVIVGGKTVLEPAPYAWLLSVPGFDRLRVPTRIWMCGTLCLSVAMGLSYLVLFRRPSTRMPAMVVIASALVIDGWAREIPMAAAPELWPRVERRDQPFPVIEIPLGPSWDAAATYRAVWHRRGTVNGVSGYDPPHYAPLQEGLNAYDPQTLLALASLETIDLVVDGANDRDGRWAAYVTAAPGATVVARDGVRTTHRIPKTAPLEPVLGPPLPIAAMEAFRHDARAIWDGHLETEWRDDPQREGQWVTADLGSVREVRGITHSLGEYARDFPRLLSIDVSVDGARWDEAWRGPTAALAFLAAAREPRAAAMRIGFAPRPARFVRLRQLAAHKNYWRIAELSIH